VLFQTIGAERVSSGAGTFDSQGSHPEIGLLNSPDHPYQPDLRILTRSANRTSSRDFSGRRRFYSRVPNPQPRATDGGRRRVRRIVYPHIHQLFTRPITRTGDQAGPRHLLRYRADPSGYRHPRRRLLAPDNLSVHGLQRQQSPLGSCSFAESRDLPVRDLHRSRRRSGCSSEQLPYLCAPGRHLDSIQSGAHYLLAGHCIQTTYLASVRFARGAGGGVGNRRFGRLCVSASHSGTSASPSRVSVRPYSRIHRSGRPKGWTDDGPGHLRGLRIPSEFPVGHLFCHFASNAERERRISLRGRAPDAARPRKLCDRNLNSTLADNVSSSRRWELRRDEADVRLFAANRLVHNDSCRRRPNSPAGADYPGTFSAWPVRRALHGTNRKRSALLRAWPARLRRDLAHHSDVLFHSGHAHSCTNWRLHDRRQSHIQRRFPPVFLPQAFQREPGAGEFALRLFEFRSALFDLSQSIWAARHSRHSRVDYENHDFHRRNGRSGVRNPAILARSSRSMACDGTNRCFGADDSRGCCRISWSGSPLALRRTKRVLASAQTRGAGCGARYRLFGMMSNGEAAD